MIETVIIYKLPRLSHKEIQAMLQISDIRESRVFQEAKEEGLKEGEEKGRREGIALAISKMAARKMSIAEIADILGLDLDRVQQAMTESGRT